MITWLFILPIAPPDHLVVGGIAVPNLAAEEAATINAYDPAGKAAVFAILTLESFVPAELNLCQIEHLCTDDGGIAVFHIVTGNLLAGVDYKNLTEKVRSVNLLKYGIALILFIDQDALHRADRPFWHANRSVHLLAA